jgi:hypothetical protein
MEIIDSNMEEVKSTKNDEEQEAAIWAADRLNDVFDDNSENEVLLSQYDINNKRNFIS